MYAEHAPVRNKAGARTQTSAPTTTTRERCKTNVLKEPHHSAAEATEVVFISSGKNVAFKGSLSIVEPLRTIMFHKLFSHGQTWVARMMSVFSHAVNVAKRCPESARNKLICRL